MGTEHTIDLGPVRAGLGVHVVFLRVSRGDEIYVRVLLEAYEGMGVARSHDHRLSPGRTLLCLLVVPDFAEDARRLLEDLVRTAEVELEPSTPQRIAELERELA